jgi:hypothetical protein
MAVNKMEPLKYREGQYVRVGILGFDEFVGIIQSASAGRRLFPYNVIKVGQPMDHPVPMAISREEILGPYYNGLQLAVRRAKGL